jgi:hypothetical protein
LFKEIIAVYNENLTKHINALCGKMQSYLLLKKVVNISIAGQQMVNIISINCCFLNYKILVGFSKSYN